MRPYRRARRQKKRHRRKPVVLAGQIEIAVQNEVGKIREPAMLEIHQQKGEIIKHVDRSELVREFEAIEQGRPAVEQADVAEMEVTVAAPHFSGRAPPVEQGSDGREPLQRSLPDLDNNFSDKTGMRRRRQTAMVRLDDSGQRRGAAVIGAWFGCLMES